MRKSVFLSATLASAALSACIEQAPPRQVYVAPRPPVYSPATAVYVAPAPQPVVSIYIEPPIEQPAPVQVSWAPPPMLVEAPPPAPYAGAVWIGGYWAWEGNWVWAHGRWAPPPHPGYSWVNPYYEHRGGAVVFINGFWAAPGVSFVAPGFNIHIALGIPGPGVIPGLAPIGPAGVFVPAPPGSHPGLIVPAPVGTPPAVVTSAPPIINGGMHITVNRTTNNVTNVTNVTNITNITNVTVVAPASATATGQAVNASVPAQAHLAAAMHPVVKAMAPEPASSRPIPAFAPGRAPVALPPAQTVHAEVPPALTHPQPAQPHPAGQLQNSTQQTQPTATPEHHEPEAHAESHDQAQHPAQNSAQQQQQHQEQQGASRIESPNPQRQNTARAPEPKKPEQQEEVVKDEAHKPEQKKQPAEASSPEQKKPEQHAEKPRPEQQKSEPKTEKSKEEQAREQQKNGKAKPEGEEKKPGEREQEKRDE